MGVVGRTADQTAIDGEVGEALAVEVGNDRLAIGLGNLEPLAPGDSLTTRLADIRVTLSGTNDGLLLITESHGADWLWTWLLARLGVTGR